MKSLHVELPDEVVADIAQLIQAGWFRSENELVRAAVIEFLRTRQAELQERFQREDISWAVAEAKPDTK